MMSVLTTLAQDAPVDPTTGKGPEWGKAAPIALLIILLMGLALFVLIRSMNRQLKKVPSDFMRGATTAAVDAGAPGATSQAAATPAQAAATPAEAAVSPPGDPDPTTRS